MDQPNYEAEFGEKSDVFERKAIGEGLLRHIENQDEHHGAITVAIDAPWGIGKTTFIHMMEKLIKKKEYGWWTVYYDAWMNDYSPDPFSSLLFQICGQSSRNCPSLSLKDKLSLDKVLDSFGKMVTTIPNGYTAVGGAVLQQVPKFLNSDIISKLYTEQEQHRQLFHENLTAMAKNCKKLIVFIDELDRCKPSFAVQTLETIKHYFDVDNVVFIFGIDGIQIRETIRKFYGAGFDSSSYLTRFFESQILLPKPTIDQMIQFCIKEIYVPTNEREWLRKLLNYAAITPREVTSVLSDAKLILDYCDLKDDHVAATSLFLLIVLLLSMKCKKMETYELIIAGKLEAPKSQLWSEKFNVEDVMYCISEMCTASVNTIRSSGHKPIGTEDALSENNIYAAMKYLLSHADESAIVGNEVTQIMNMIAIPIMKNDEKEGVI